MNIGFVNIGFVNIGFVNMGFVNMGFVNMGFVNIGFVNIGFVNMFVNIGFVCIGFEKHGLLLSQYGWPLKSNVVLYRVRGSIMLLGKALGPWMLRPCRPHGS